MKAVVLVVGVLGLAAVFGLCEPTPGSGTAVTSGDVRLVSEQMSEQTSSQLAARVRNGKANGVSSFKRGSRFFNQDGDSW